MPPASRPFLRIFAIFTPSARSGRNRVLFQRHIKPELKLRAIRRGAQGKQVFGIDWLTTSARDTARVVSALSLRQNTRKPGTGPDRCAGSLGTTHIELRRSLARLIRRLRRLSPHRWRRARLVGTLATLCSSGPETDCVARRRASRLCRTLAAGH